MEAPILSDQVSPINCGSARLPRSSEPAVLSDFGAGGTGQRHQPTFRTEKCCFALHSLRFPIKTEVILHSYKLIEAYFKGSI